MAKGSIGYYKLKNGEKRYFIRYDTDGIGGKRKQIKKTIGPSYRKALNELDKALNQTQPKNVLFSNFSRNWLKTSEVNLKPSTLKRYQGILDNHLIPAFGSYYLSEIKLEMLDGFKYELQKKGYKPATVNKTIVVLKIIFKRAYQYEKITKNPTEYLKQVPVQKTKKDFLRPNELKMFLDYVKENQPKWYPFFLTAVYTGARRNELLALKWSDINYKTNEIRFEGSLYKNKILTTKTDSVGLVIVPSAVIEAIKSHPKVINPLDLIFVRSTGNPYEGSYITRRVFHRFLRLAGLRKVKFHSLRDSYNSILISAGANIKSVQEQLRHSTLAMTDLYGHGLREDKIKAVSRVEEIVTKSVSKSVKSTEYADSAKH